MDVIADIFQNMWRYASAILITDILDILILTVLIYKAIQLLRRTNAFLVVRGLIILLVVLWTSEILKLNVLYYLLSNTLQIGLVALLVVFQPELRRMLERMGQSRFPQIFSRDPKTQMQRVILQTVQACSSLSWQREGALIVFQRKSLLDEICHTGTMIGGEVTAELLKNIFYPKAPLHDGAVIIQDVRVAAAGCMLPLTKSNNLNKEFGMRHKAGIGMSENSDAIVIIVSEESGSISVAEGGMIKRHLAPETLEALLTKELIPPEEEKKGVSRFFTRRAKDGKQDEVD